MTSNDVKACIAKLLAPVFDELDLSDHNSPVEDKALAEDKPPLDTNSTYLGDGTQGPLNGPHSHNHVIEQASLPPQQLHNTGSDSLPSISVTTGNLLLTSSKISSLTLAPLPPYSSSSSSHSITSASSTSFPNMDVHNLHLAPLPPQPPSHTTPTSDTPTSAAVPTANHVTSLHEEFGIQETSVFAVSTTSEHTDASSHNSVSPSSMELRQSAIENLSEQIALHMLQSDSGYLQKLLLLDHIDQVQQKILKWIDNVDEQIDGRSNYYNNVVGCTCALEPL